jgi:hypothetical protein
MDGGGGGVKYVSCFRELLEIFFLINLINLI